MNMDNTMKYLYISLLLFISPSLSLAGGVSSSYSGDSLHKYYVELHYLYETGLAIHQQFDTSDRSTLKACQSEWGFISTRAKTLIGIANRLQHPNKDELIASGWAALGCVKCTSDVEVCTPIPATLKKVEQELLEARKNQQ
jgi:hypothetical protein